MAVKNNKNGSFKQQKLKIVVFKIKKCYNCFTKNRSKYGRIERTTVTRCFRY